MCNSYTWSDVGIDSTCDYICMYVFPVMTQVFMPGRKEDRVSDLPAGHEPHAVPLSL